MWFGVANSGVVVVFLCNYMTKSYLLSLALVHYSRCFRRDSVVDDPGLFELLLLLLLLLDELLNCLLVFKVFIKSFGLGY